MQIKVLMSIPKISMLLTMVQETVMIPRMIALTTVLMMTVRMMTALTMTPMMTVRMTTALMTLPTMTVKNNVSAYLILLTKYRERFSPFPVFCYLHIFIRLFIPWITSILTTDIP